MRLFFLLNLIFLDISASYIKNWAQNILPFATTFKWIELREMLLWSTGNSPVHKFAQYMIDQKCLKTTELDQLFTEFSYVKSYLKGNHNIFEEWNKSKTSIVGRWQDVFSNLKQQCLPFDVFFKLVEYVLVIPGKQLIAVCSDETISFIRFLSFAGANCDCERLFSYIKNYWTDRKSSLSLTTLTSWLLVKHNLQFSCEEFYEFIKTQPDWLQKV